MGISNPMLGLSAVTGVATGSSADLTGGVVNNLLGNHSAIVTVSGWTANSNVGYTPGVGVVMQASLDGNTWVNIANTVVYGNGVYQLRGVQPARFLRCSVSSVDPNVTAFSCSAYVGGSA